MIGAPAMDKRRHRLLVSACVLGAAGWLIVTLIVPGLREDAVRRELRPSGSASRLRALIERGAPLNVRDVESGLTPLMWAARAGDAPLVALLLQKGADVAERDGARRTALCHAAAAGEAEIARTFLALPAESVELGVNEALLAAAGRGRLQLIALLLESGADANARVGLHGGTPLATAVRRGQLASVKLLLASGADPYVKDAGNVSPLDVALASHREAAQQPAPEPRRTRQEILRLLRKHAATARTALDPFDQGPATYTVERQVGSAGR